jgi:Mg-chelatase subunit ChlD
MINRLSQLRPHQGTPLADGLLQGGELADGVTRQSTILLVSDGEENCGGDPCFVARNLKRQKPHLKINVIDIGGTGAANCAAELTGGKVYTVSNVKELNLAVERATQETLGPAHCVKPK